MPPQMEIIERVRFEVVIHSWLKDEWFDSAFDIYRNSVNLIGNPDFSNKIENQKRLKILLHKRFQMYSSILENAEWFKVKLTKINENKIYYCCSSEWVYFSNKTMQPKGAHSNVFPTSKVDISRANKIKEIYNATRGSPHCNGIILVGLNFDSVFTLIEGNHRFTATSYNLRYKENDTVSSEFAYLGLSPEMNSYHYHIGRLNPHL